MKRHTCNFSIGRALALLLAALLLCGSLGACSLRPDGEGLFTAEPSGEPRPTELAEPENAPAPDAPAEPTLAPAPTTSLEGLHGRWDADDGSAELWIQSVEGEDVVFSLLIRGSSGIYNARALGAENGFFFFQNPYQEGVGASGALQLDNGVPVLTIGESRLQFPAGTVLRFSARSEGADYAELYAPVLDAYRSYERNGGGMENWYADEHGYVHVGLYGTERVGVLYWDLDFNGVPELLLGAWHEPDEDGKAGEMEEQEYWDNLILDLYTLEQGEPRYVVNSGDRFRYSLTTDGQIYYEGSAGATYTYIATYLLNGAALEMTAGFCMDGSEEECFTVDEQFNFDRVGYEPISEEEFLWLCDSYQRLYRYDRWAPLPIAPLTQD